jgi:hypothetical protein
MEEAQRRGGRAERDRNAAPSDRAQRRDGVAPVLPDDEGRAMNAPANSTVQMSSGSPGLH